MERLQKIDRMDAEIYAEASGQPIDRILELMDESTLLDAEAALDMGFVHAIEGQGGQTGRSEDWHEVAQFVVNHDLDILSPAGQAPDAVLSRALTEYDAVQSSDYPPTKAPPGGWPEVSGAESEELRRRESGQLERLAWRLRAYDVGAAPDPRFAPVAADWRCDTCGARNFHPPGQHGRPTPCAACAHISRKDQ
jgi:hypothetical protein